MTLPVPLQRAYALWMRFSRALGLVMSWILLTILWLTVFGIYAIIRKVIVLFTPQKQLSTYWLPVRPEPPDGMDHPF